MLLLEPVMREMVKLFHVPEVSGLHSVVQVPPSLKDSPGPGAVGTTPVARLETPREAEGRADAPIAAAIRASDVMCTLANILGFFNLSRR